MKECMLRINGQLFGVGELLQRLGVKEPLKTLQVVRPVASGNLVADVDVVDEMYPGIDLLLELPSESKQVARVEQDQAEPDAVQLPRSYLYGLTGDVVAYMPEIDTRSSEEIPENDAVPDRIVVGGASRAHNVELRLENVYVSVRTDASR